MMVSNRLILAAESCIKKSSKIELNNILIVRVDKSKGMLADERLMHGLKTYTN